MTPRLPSLEHLRVFEAAARHLSFQVAASELHVTPAAVSQRVRTLEAALGTKLFKRLTRQVLLTHEGQMLAIKLREGLAIIAEGVSALDTSRTHRPLTISTTTTFAEQCLLPRLAQFSVEYPECDIRVLASNDLVDFEMEAVDLAIRQGLGRYPGCNSQAFLDDLYVPVCSPELWASGAFASKAWLNGPLIHVDWPAKAAIAPRWESWFMANAVEPPRDQRRIEVPFEALAIRAAVRNQGVALIHKAHIAHELARGELILPFGDQKTLRPEFRYYIVNPRTIRNPNAELLRSWLLRNMHADLADQHF